jgi:hypothetical protein
MIRLHVRSGGRQRERCRPTCPTDASARRKFPAPGPVDRNFAHCPRSHRARRQLMKDGWRDVRSTLASMKGKKMEWSLMTIVGPILFAVVLLWAMTHNRRSRAEKQRTEEATRQRRAEEDADQKARGV